MHPPEFLVPLQFLLRRALAVKEVEDSAIFLVPAYFDDGEGDSHALVYQGFVVSADAEVHHEPKGLKIVARVDLPALEAVEP